ncbi:DNA-directed RNA polymerase subunit RPB2 [uncultured virus]|nr:DNA-directed RNA polymerase subunit RPB2 [uncultured virus]
MNVVKRSVIINQSSLDRGFMRSTSLKKYMTTIQKNQSTSQDDLFIKPDQSKVTGMRHGSYDKLNEKGYVPEETKIENGDIIIGKVSPIQPMGNNTKTFKDSSEVYKSQVPGTVDRVWTDIYNNEGYEMRKMRVRSERIPHIGDKFCSRHGQKGTCGITLPCSDMMFTESGIQPDIIMNPNAIPSRMTIGQFVECLVGKVSALRGHETDGTPFNRPDIESIKDILGELGYEKNGYETLYNGMTGKKLRTEIFIGPTYYQRLKHMVSDKIHCICYSTEVLTFDGWKTIHNLTLNDKIATLDNDKLIYQNPIKIMKYPNYEGPIYHIKNQAIDLMVTGNHRMYISKKYGRQGKWQEYKLERADCIIGKYVRYKKDAEWLHDNYQFILPNINQTKHVIKSEKMVDMTSWLIFLGIWIAEGNTSGKISSGHVQIAVHKQRVKDRLYPALEKLGYEYKIYDNVLNIYDKQLYTYMKPLSLGSTKKILPKWVYNLSKTQSKLLIDSMLLGDGTYPKSMYGAYYTSSINLANDVQQLCLHCGWTAMISIHIKKGNSTIIRGKKVINNENVLRISIITKRTNPSANHSHVNKQNAQIESFQIEKRPVFCLQVPSEIFYVRRNGKGVWTGNSRSVF